MGEIWNYLFVGYWVIVTIYSVIYLIKILFPHYIYSIDDVSVNKLDVYQCVIEFVKEDFGIDFRAPTINFIYEPNNEMKGCYEQKSHSITLYIENLDSIHSFILTLIEEIHHSVFVSTKSSIKIYELYDRKVGYDNNPLESAAKLYSVNKFRSIHRKLKKRGLISYKHQSPHKKQTG